MYTFNINRNATEGFRCRNMIALVLLPLLMLCVSRAQAQTNNNHLTLGVGWFLEGAVDAALAVEHSTRYHNAWEFFGNYYVQYEEDPVAGHITKQSFWHSYNSWHLGICYKPCVTRGRNHHGNFRVGASCGSDLDDFIGGIHLGYEHTYALYRGWEVFFQVKENVIIPRSANLFRTGVSIGFKIPLSGVK